MKTGKTTNAWKRMRRITACLILLILCLNFPTWTPALTDENGGALPNSIASLEQIELGGILFAPEYSWEKFHAFMLSLKQQNSYP
ncbi:hypothetical protein [Brevibacillus invocatus]|uniref:hypothetical protein n=1 Tax=Brevibacillus invocatus TaxID=173959 RepID=UPI00203D9B93|nr:hypothetical protein [Brevibacillus invocatus]MCM3080315.1 hypothetical protein [Brevibacillus invocatus]MCM3430432.1 hypothetical protein [Brevibacillus invocatus]